MQTSILDFLRTKTKEKLGRLLNQNEEDKLCVIASRHEKKLKANLIDEMEEFVLLNCKCHKCNVRNVAEEGMCHICKLCEENEIADVDEFNKFYNSCATGNDNAKIIYYKLNVEQNGGI